MASKKHLFFFETCCFCMSLKSACFLMAYMQLVGIIFGATYAGVVIGHIVNKANEKYQYINPLWILVAILLLLAVVIILIFNIVLIIGLHKNKPGLVKAYLIFNTILIVIFAVLVISSLASGFASAPVIITRIVQIFMNTYYLLVYRNYYITMKETPEQTV